MLRVRKPLKFYFSIFMSLYFLSFPFCMANASECSIPAPLDIDVHFNGFIPTTTVLINNQKVSMGIDTGAQQTVLAPDLVRRLKLQMDLHNYTNIFGTSGHTKAPNVFVDTLTFGNNSYNHLSLPVVSLELSSSQARLTSPPLDGLIGVDILSQYDLEFDFSHNNISLYRPTICTNFSPPWHHKFDTIPAVITPSHRIMIPIKVEDHTITAIFDTGASGERLAPQSINRAGLIKEKVERDLLQTGSGVGGGAYKAPVHNFKYITVGNNTYSHIKFDIVDLGSTESDALLGEDYISTRHFWLSYANSILFIQQASNP